VPLQYYSCFGLHDDFKKLISRSEPNQKEDDTTQLNTNNAIVI
jgi:hypothetical protein